MAGTWFANLMEFACELTSSWPPARVEGRVLAALLSQDPANPANTVNLTDLLNPLSVPECLFSMLPHYTFGRFS